MNAANSVGPWPARRNVLKLDIMVSVATPAEGRSGRHMNAHNGMSMTRSAVAVVGCSVTPGPDFARPVPDAMPNPATGLGAAAIVDSRCAAGAPFSPVKRLSIP